MRQDTTLLNGSRSDYFMAFGLLGVLFVLIIPLPPVVLDLAITINLSLALVVLLITLTVREPLEFSTFPSLLLFTTLYRLALNVASTRLILLDGNAGNMIQAFGDFVVGGQLLVGLVIFLILVIIQFVVITKGSNRISEVAARFVLDAMPGKQMAIDADLNAGLISEDDARNRRENITAEAEFYGAMDGAGKFVRGDAIAGLIITLVNILGGIGIGLSRDMGLVDALRVYSVLTIGDGLVSQIPALVIAISSGVLVTKTRSAERLSHEITNQFLLKPAALRISAAMVAVFGLVPGLPTVPFMVLALCLFAVARAGRRVITQANQAEQEVPPEPEKASELTPEALESLLKVDRMGIEIGYRLISLVDEKRTGNLLDHIAMVRKQFAQKYGFVVPPIRLRDNLSIPANQYRITVSGQPIAEGELYPEHVLAIDPSGAAQPVKGIATKDPTFGLPATWVPVHQKSDAELLGYTAIDPESVLVTHLTEVIKLHAHEILTREDVHLALERVKAQNPTVINELSPDTLPLGNIQLVLSNLLRDQVPIRDLPAILETLADACRTEKDPNQLTEIVRQRLARTVCTIHTAATGRIEALTLAPALEQGLMNVFSGHADPSAPALSATALHQFQDAALKAWQDAQAAGREPVLLVRATLRRHLADMFRAMKPPLPVLSFNEVMSGGGVDSVGVIQLPASPSSRATMGAAHS